MIRKFLKKIKNRIEPYNLYQKNRAVLDINKELRDRYVGKKCFIIGNGPSINDQDFLKLRDEQTFVVNTFWNHPQYKEINPKYYLIVDSDVFPVGNQKNNFFSDEILQKHELLSSCPTKFFFHAFGKEFIEKNGLFKNSKVYYLMNHGALDEKFSFDMNIDKIIPYTKNVIAAAIMIAAYMGFEEIYLLGCEHDFLAYPSYKHYEKFPHFFNSPYNLNEKDKTDYYAMAVMSYEKHIYSVLVLFRNYRLLKEKLAREKPHIKIFNATPNSFLDVFPFVKFEDIKF